MRNTRDFFMLMFFVLVAVNLATAADDNAAEVSTSDEVHSAEGQNDGGQADGALM